MGPSVQEYFKGGVRAEDWTWSCSREDSSGRKAESTAEAPASVCLSRACLWLPGAGAAPTSVQEHARVLPRSEAFFTQTPTASAHRTRPALPCYCSFNDTNGGPSKATRRLTASGKSLQGSQEGFLQKPVEGGLAFGLCPVQVSLLTSGARSHP